MTYRIRSLIEGEDAITLEDGQLVFDQIYAELVAGRAVELDFSGITVFASPFFNAALGQLLKNLKSDDLNRLVTVSNLLPIGRDLAHRAIENAKRYFAEPNYREAQRRVLESLAQEC